MSFMYENCVELNFFMSSGDRLKYFGFWGFGTGFAGLLPYLLLNYSKMSSILYFFLSVLAFILGQNLGSSILFSISLLLIIMDKDKSKENKRFSLTLACRLSSAT